MRSTLLALTFLFTASTAFAQDAKVVTPFNGKDLTGWTFKGKEGAKKSQWKVGSAVLDEKNPTQLTFAATGSELVNVKSSVDLATEEKFADCKVEIELMIPKGSNSGIYLMGEYEVQVLDSFGRAKIGPGDMGGLYQAATPLVNACKKPGEWQTFVIDFQAPRFDSAGKKTANAKFLKVVLNDQIIHENVEMKKGQTPGGLTGREVPAGPLMFQGDHGPVSFRNIKITKS